MSLQRNLEHQFFTILEIEMPRVCHKLEEERDLVCDAERQNGRNEQLNTPSKSIKQVVSAGWGVKNEKAVGVYCIV